MSGTSLKSELADGRIAKMHVRMIETFKCMGKVMRNI